MKDDLGDYRAVCLAQNDQDIEAAVELAKSMVMSVAACVTSEHLKRSSDKQERFIGLLLSIGYCAIAEIVWERGAPEGEDQSDG